MKTLILTVGVFLLAVSAAFAQTDRGTITGTVLDPAGAVVPNATIEAKNTSTNQTYNAGTTGTGNYTLSALPAGTYEITVNASGFKKYVRPNITVQVAETSRVDATLEVGATTDTVTVNAEAPLLKTESGELSHQIDYTEADSIPLFTLNGSGSEGIGNIRDPLSVSDHPAGRELSLPITRFASTVCPPARKRFAWKGRTPPTAFSKRTARQSSKVWMPFRKYRSRPAISRLSMGRWAAATSTTR